MIKEEVDQNNENIKDKTILLFKEFLSFVKKNYKDGTPADKEQEINDILEKLFGQFKKSIRIDVTNFLANDEFNCESLNNGFPAFHKYLSKLFKNTNGTVGTFGKDEETYLYNLIFNFFVHDILAEKNINEDACEKLGNIVYDLMVVIGEKAGLSFDVKQTFTEAQQELFEKYKQNGVLTEQDKKTATDGESRPSNSTAVIAVVSYDEKLEFTQLKLNFLHSFCYLHFQQKLEQQKLEQQKLEQEKLEQEKLEQEKLEQEKLEQQQFNNKQSMQLTKSTIAGTIIGATIGLLVVATVVALAIFAPYTLPLLGVFGSFIMGTSFGLGGLAVLAGVATVGMGVGLLKGGISNYIERKETKKSVKFEIIEPPKKTDDLNDQNVIIPDDEYSDDEYSDDEYSDDDKKSTTNSNTDNSPPISLETPRLKKTTASGYGFFKPGSDKNDTPKNEPTTKPNI